jgi:5-methylcytosine-specific restriction protein A
LSELKTRERHRPPVGIPVAGSRISRSVRVDADVDSQTDIAEEFGIQTGTPVTETRKYVYHRKIERNRTAARKAKQFHGTRCQACKMDFGERYGDLGKGFIEAHHLRPIATLEEGVPVKYDVAADFSVLCPNCHRMIHRSSDPSDIVAFRSIINED